jgi:hypothetical protein
MFLPSKEADLALAARIKAADKHRCARQPNENANPVFVEIAPKFRRVPTLW